MPTERLEVRDLHAGYGRGDIVRHVDLSLKPGELVTIIGPNGAGKSTLIKAVAGVVRPRLGQVRLGDAEVAGESASEIAARGLAYVPQEASVFRHLSVRENLEMGCWLKPDALADGLERVFQLFPILKDRQKVRAGRLSGGQRQMAALAMALMTAPAILVLDEPSAGLAPIMVEQMLEIIHQINETGVAVLMVEQNAIQALKVSDRGYVMAAGEVAMTGEASALLANKEVSELYLGTRA
ncbi:MAG: ABC transporter ATP-binding protein [Geminicoccaceae bacterium]